MQQGDPQGITRTPQWIGPAAFVLGVAVAVGSLSYAPGGRLNVLWLWLLWAGLPLVGALVSLGLMLWGRSRPWLFRWRQQTWQWYPTKLLRWQLLYYLQLAWLLLGLGLFLGFWVLLLFSDLAFGWSSTLLDGDRALPLLQILAFPWQSWWPAASPDAALMESTRYLRIAPHESAAPRAGDWWPFLMASLLVYNLLPRVLLTGISWWQWRWHARQQRMVQVIAPAYQAHSGERLPALQREAITNWASAAVLNWEVELEEAPTLGGRRWHQDQEALKALLAGAPSRLLWCVPANRSPVGEMADLIEQARRAGVPEQGVRAVTDSQTDEQRHVLSWQQFARQHQLTWVTP